MSINIDKVLLAIQIGKANAKSTAHHNRPTIGDTKIAIQNVIGDSNKDLIDSITNFAWLNTPFTFNNTVIDYDWYIANR